MTEPGGRDATLSVVRANLLALAWLPVAGLIALGPFLLRWGWPVLERSWPSPEALPIVLLVLVVSVLAHEGLHAAGFLLVGKAPPDKVRLGFSRRTLTPYASCSAPVTAAAYRVTALLPAAGLGLLPAAVASLAGWGLLALWSWAMLAVAGGDLAAVWAIRRVPAKALVLDHPSRVGCRTLGPEPGGGPGTAQAGGA